MELIEMQTAAMTLSLEAGWKDVIDEITASCVRRAEATALLNAPGVVGVLSGAAPVVWVHGETDGDHLADILAGAPEVDEVYVSDTETATLDALRRNGWTTADVVAQTVCPSVELLLMPGEAPCVEQLGPEDMADVRALLGEHGEVEEHVLKASYGDNFFEVAAPVWLLGARDAEGRLIGVLGIRKQGRSAMGFALTVHRTWRATGLSSRLITAGLGLVASIGVDFIHAQANERSIGALTGCGFSVVGRWVRLVRA